ncbi:MAG TPA: AraC family transcriptional regulator [Anaerolineales bacterium]|nr:AraC family transcriptional regulator [Anaerolineales bacterium]
MNTKANPPVPENDIQLMETLHGNLGYVAHSDGLNQRHCCLHSPVHRHNWYEIALMQTHSSKLFIDFEEYPLSGSYLLFLSPGQVHTWVGDLNAISTRVVGFVPELFALDSPHFQHAWHKVPFWSDSTLPFFQLETQQTALFTQLFGLAEQRFQFAKPAQTEQMLRAYINLILTEIQANLIDSPTSEADAQFAAPTLLTRKFRMAVEQDFLQRRQVQEYAQQLGVTDNHLVKTVRQTTGRTPKQILQDRLLLEAKRLLIYTPLSAAQIGEQLSFPNPTQFGRWFKSNLGLAPQQFRQSGFAG